MGVHLGSAILQKRPNILKTGENCGMIPGQSSMCGSRQARPDVRRILVQHEHRKNVPEQHSNEDEPDPAKHEQAPRAQGSKR